MKDLVVPSNDTGEVLVVSICERRTVFAGTMLTASITCSKDRRVLELHSLPWNSKEAHVVTPITS